MSTLLIFLRFVLAATFAVAAVAKFADLAGSRKSMRDFGLPARLAGLFSVGVPVVELAAAIALIPGRTAWIGAAVALLLLIGFIAAIALNLALGRRPDCHCFGQIHSSPIGRKTLARNVLLAAAAAVVLWPGRGAAQPDVGWWAAVAALVALNFWIMVYLLRQNGRLMLRIEEIEAHVGIGATEPPPPGLPVGTSAPGFEHEGATLGGLLAAGKPVLLIFVEPDCAPCKALAPEIAAWEKQYAGRLTVRVVSETGDKRAVADAYQYAGTPGAVLIGADGKIASPVAAGPDAIRRLVEQAAAPPPARPGDPAPAVRLSGLDGADVDLASLRGSRVAVLFWNPNCGYCREMLERVRAWESEAAGHSLRLLVVSTGSVEENRAQGFRSPVAIDGAFATGRAFGAEGTPSAVVVAADGTIGSEIAVGAENVMRLLKGEGLKG